MNKIAKHRLVFPKTILIETMSVCNGKCQMCAYPDLKEKQNDVLDTEVFNNIINQLVDKNMKRITLYCNNEPLLDERIYELIAYTKKNNRTAQIDISTNAKVLDYKKAKALKDAGLDLLWISIPTLDAEKYNELMGGSLDVVLKNIDEIFEKEVGLQIVIGATETKYYKEEIFREYFGPRNIRFYSWPLENRGGNVKQFEKYKAEATEYNWKPCDRPLDQMVILSNGDVVICCGDWRHEVVFGNVYHSTLEEIWNSDITRKYQKYIEEDLYCNIPICARCSENPQMCSWNK